MDALSSAAEAYDYPCNLQAGKYGSGLRAFQDIQAAGMQPNVVSYCGGQPFRQIWGFGKNNHVAFCLRSIQIVREWCSQCCVRHIVRPYGMALR